MKISLSMHTSGVTIEKCEGFDCTVMGIRLLIP